MRALLVLGALLLPLCQAQSSDVILRAMKDELERSRMLKVASLDTPYFIQYDVADADMLSISATLGALLNMNRVALRIPDVRVRVGNFAFDNTNYVYSDYYGGSRYDTSQLPLDNNYLAFRQVFWLATDRAFKGAEEAIGRKRSALKNINLQQELPDFSPAQPVQAILPIEKKAVDAEAWKNRVVKLSAVFTGYPRVLSSALEFESTRATNYLVNSEGTAIVAPEDVAFLRVRAYAQASDGMALRDADVFQVQDVSKFPSDAELQRGVTAVAGELTALAAAPMGEAYDGPVLFEPRAAAQLMGQLLGDNLKITRKPIGEPGRALPHLPSDFENKIGSRVLPDWMDVVDDPTQAEWRGQALFGHYEFDSEGVRPGPLTLVEKGVLKTLLMTRTPVSKGLAQTNGRARLHGGFGAFSPGFGNLFIRASKTTPAADLKKALIEQIKQRNKPYGMLVRKLDFPSGMTVEELRRSAPGGGRPVAMPLLVYRVYPDGREELVRGLRFRGLTTRSLKDITAATEESYVLNFMDSVVPLALMGAGGFVTNATVVAPGLMFDELEFEPVQENLPKLPIVPAPPLTSMRGSEWQAKTPASSRCAS